MYHFTFTGREAAKTTVIIREGRLQVDHGHHGTPDESFTAAPASHGCVRMRNADLVALFDATPAYTPVFIAST